MAVGQSDERLETSKKLATLITFNLNDVRDAARLTPASAMVILVKMRKLAVKVLSLAASTVLGLKGRASGTILDGPACLFYRTNWSLFQQAFSVVGK